MPLEVGEKVRVKQGVRNNIGDDWIGNVGLVYKVETDYPHTCDYWIVVEDAEGKFYLPAYEDEVEVVEESAPTPD